MIILGIETSCDETSASIVKDGQTILTNVVSSSMAKHAQTGGIIPEVAAREQSKYMIPVLDEAISSIARDIDAIAVTVGPGLVGSLLVGVESAKTLSKVWQKPIVPVNHLVAHLYANWLAKEQRAPQFPLIALVVSGGHTDLVLMKGHGKIKWIGGTRDDAAGECFDKCARLLGLGYPGGPAVSAEAEKFKIQNSKLKIRLPRPIISEDNFDFSFSGLKTAVLREVNKLKDNNYFNNQTVEQLSWEIQEAVTDVLVSKTIKAAEKFKVKSIILAGGVSANSRLREKFNHQSPASPKLQRGESIINRQFQLHIPPPSLCTDNAAYIASYAYFNYKPVPWREIKVLPGLTITGEI
ncbi:MAG: tRNA (adenosine(37)-N6)-threonylcarbamoyltransferase complex transferase subunit TsaD [bacterium]|nr:tRNA (adenosine(37)-N6)-threonylcarbamoyltransferase complex transferase subunit TsaD [bacterium]